MMKKLILISILAFTVASLLGYGQTKNNSNRSIVSGNSKPGLMNITELSGGIGLYSEDREYAKRNAGLTSILGIGLTKNLTGGIGIGVSIYDGGSKVLYPLFADLRYFFNLGKARFFASGDVGILLNSAKTEAGTFYFVSPGLGWALPVSKNLSINLGAALFTQYGGKDYGTDSFVNIKLGMTYFFKKN
jgi:hypothetical protein